MATTFIYALCEPGTRTVRYIGKSIRPQKRLTQHVRYSSKQKTHLGNWLRSLGGQAPNLVILREVPEGEGSAEEIKYILIARASLGMKLVNGTDGGEGLTNPSPETREKIGAAQRGLKRGPLSSEHRVKISVQKKGKPLSPAQLAANPVAIEAMRVSNLGRVLPPRTSAHRAALSAAMKGRTCSPEHCAAVSAATKGKPRAALTPQRCAAMSIQRKGKPWTLARRAAQISNTFK